MTTATQTLGSPANAAATTPLLEVSNLTKHFPIRRGLLGRTQGYVQAVTNISSSIGSAPTLGKVGEAGRGKTTAGRWLLRLVRVGDKGEAFRAA